MMALEALTNMVRACPLAVCLYSISMAEAQRALDKIKSVILPRSDGRASCILETWAGCHAQQFAEGLDPYGGDFDFDDED